jgi:hypothetical protein
MFQWLRVAIGIGTQICITTVNDTAASNKPGLLPPVYELFPCVYMHWLDILQNWITDSERS